VTASCILFIEDDPAGRELGQYNLKRAGYAVDAVIDGEEGLARFSPERHALVVTDVRMPRLSGLDVLRAVKARAPNVPVIVITAFADVEVAVEAMKAGAADFIGKPFNRDHLLLTVEKALAAQRLTQEVRSLRIRASGVERAIVCTSAVMTRLLDTVDRVAASEATVLIQGESGTGKELIARRIHVRSGRAEGPFVAINCAAVPRDLLEAELFGHTRGAFTGAIRSRLGKFRQAAGGTLFLDEISELPLPVQGKLLRVLQERVVDVLGSDAPEPVDVRLVAATNQDLRARVREQEFREDLFYRLAVFEVLVHPLRERLEDLPLLVEHFVARFARGRDLIVPESLVQELARRPWPGNVRELENAIERVVILSRDDVLRQEDLPHLAEVTVAPPTGQAAPPAVGEPGEWPPLPPDGLSLVELERSVIERVLALKQWNISQSARYLGVPRHILTYRMEKHGIRRPT
jgi:two-component system NtrC family response regulator